jgi:hypothetical protein
MIEVMVGQVACSKVTMTAYASAQAELLPAPQVNNRHVSWIVLGMVAVFALGGWATHSLTQPVAQALAHLSGKVGLPVGTSDAELLTRFNTIDWSQPQPQGTDEIVRGLGTSAALRTQLLARWRQAGHHIERQQLQDLLLAAPIPDLAATAQQWAGDAQSANNRLNGFSLLGRMEPSAAAQALFMHALHHEQDAYVLATVVWALDRKDVPPPQVAGLVVARLHALTRHAQPEVRLVSIQRLADWDRGGRFFPADVQRLLHDPQSQVRMSAIAATSVASLSTEPVKQRLLALLNSAHEESDVRGVALMNLHRFDLNEAEYAAYRAGLTALEQASAAANARTAR